jgi:WD40 repeat protein/serine/threonine protein kinase
MNDDETVPLDEHFLAEMAKLDNALAAGEAPEPIHDDPTVAARLERDRACVERLRRLHPAGDRSGSLRNALPLLDRGADIAGQCLGRFRLRRELGRGGFGVVFLAFDPTLGRDVALKVPRPEYLLSIDLRERFLREARAAASLDHPHILTVYEAGEIGPIQFISSAHCAGPSLAQELKRRGEPVSFSEAATLLAAIADGVEHAHQHGIIHRDLKPSNILLFPAETPGGRSSAGRVNLRACTPRITDFGLSRRGADTSDATRTGAILGTPCYMAPEQSRGLRNANSPSVDIYALGAIGYELLTGRPPFRSETDIDTLRQVCTDDPIDPRILRPKLPADLATICLKCLEKEPGERYLSARDLAADLRRYLADEPIIAHPVSRLEHARRWCRKRPGLAVSLGALLTVSIAGFLAVVWQWRGTASALHQSDLTSYFHRVNLAHKEWLAGNVGRADQLLNECPRELRQWEWRYVRRLCDADLLALDDHSQPITRIAYSRNGRLLATVGGRWASSEPGEVQMWDAETGARRWRSVRDNGPVQCVAFSQRGKLLATGGANWERSSGEVVLWNPITGDDLFRLPDVSRSIFAVAFSPDDRILAVGQNDGLVRLWDLAAREWIGTLPSPQRQTIHAIAFSPNGRHVVTAGVGGANLWDWQTLTFLRALVGKKPYEQQLDVRDAAFSPDGRRLVIGSFDQACKLWDAESWTELDTYWGHKSPVLSVAFTADGNQIVSGDYAGAVHIRSISDPRQDRVIHGHSNAVNGIACSPDGLRIATGGADRRVRIWDATTDQALRMPGGDAVSATALVFVRRGDRLIASGYRSSWSEDGRVRIWDGKTEAAPRILDGHRRATCALACNPDGTILASGSDDRSIKLWDLDSGSVLHTLTGGHQGAIYGVAYSGDGNWLASASADKTVGLWDLRGDPTLAAMLPHPHPVRGAIFSADGAWLFTYGDGGMLMIWEVAATRPAVTLHEHDGAVNAAALSPEGRFLATGGFDQRIRIWNVANPRRPVLASVLAGHSDQVQCLAFSGDGQRLASGSRDKTAKIWDWRSASEVLTVRGQSNWVNSVVFSPDGQMLVTANVFLRILDASPCNDATKAEQRHWLKMNAPQWHLREALMAAQSDPPDRFSLFFHLRQALVPCSALE